MNKRIVVTGLGVISPVGIEPKSFFQNLMQGVSGVRQITHFAVPEDLGVKIAAEVKDFDVSHYIADAKVARQVAQYIRFGYAAARQALLDSGVAEQLTSGHLNPERIGVIAGSGMGGIEVFEDNVLRWREKGARKVNPFFIPMAITNMLAGFIAIEHGILGLNYSISTACATGNHCIMEAANAILRGDADVMVAGGSEAAINMSGLCGFAAQRALSTRNSEPTLASRPFDRDRDGFVLGEGAGMLVLECEEHASKRNAPIYARFLGGGMSSDAHHITAPHPDGTGAARAMQLALKQAGLNPEDVGYINAHGTSTPLGDKAESRAIQLVFQDYARKVPVSSTKSMIGHGLGAAAAIEAVALVLSLKNQQIHPTINVVNQDEEIPLFVVPNTGLEQTFQVGISNSFGFGGHNSCVAFGKV